jgi:hypothetical protein
MIRKFREHLGAETIVYQRGDWGREIWAIPRTPNTAIDTEAEVAVGHIDLDWSIPAEEIYFGGKIVLPEPGDIIERVLPPNNRRERYEVLPRGSANCWTGEDGATYLIRVHTKRLES